jgi:tetratricopeptide (TPR) repeat protein
MGESRAGEREPFDDADGGGDDARRGAPSGEVYDWYVRGIQLLDTGNPGAAAQLLERAHNLEPSSPSVREGLARALFDLRRYGESEGHFRGLVARNPDDDYARFGLGLALARQGAHEAALEHLALATAMRPDREEYVRALREARATVRHREAPVDGGAANAGGTAEAPGSSADAEPGA